MALTKEVQALVDQVTANTSAEASAEAVMTTMAGQIKTLTAQLGNFSAGMPVDADDLAAIVAQTGLLASSVTALTPAITANVPPATNAPTPIAPAVVNAAATSVAPPA